jgi:predicted DNA-binding protein
MLHSSLKDLLSDWEKNADSKLSSTTLECCVKANDMNRVEALARTFQKDKQAVIEDLIHAALNELESSIPYVAGEHVIRVEDGDPVYEDIGFMPEYLQNKRKIEKAL